MTTSNSVQRSAGAVALAVGGLLDIASAGVTLLGVSGDAAPIPVLLLLAVAGLASAAGLAGGRGGLLTAYAARVVSAALGIPAFFLGAPLWVDVLVGIGLVLSVAGVRLTLPALRRSPAAP